MTIAAIREKLHDYINIADDEKVKAIYTLVESEITTEYKWHEDWAFVAELDERYRRYEEGIDKSITLDELANEIESRRAQRNKNEL